MGYVLYYWVHYRETGIHLAKPSPTMRTAIALLFSLVCATAQAQQQWLYINLDVKASVTAPGEKAREWTIGAGTVWPLLRYVHAGSSDNAVLKFGPGEFAVLYAVGGTLTKVSQPIEPNEEELANYNRLVALYLGATKEERLKAAPQWMMLRADMRVTIEDNGVKPIDITLPKGSVFPLLRRVKGLDPESLDSYAVLRLGTGEFQIRYADAKQDLGVVWSVDPTPEDLGGYNRLVTGYLSILERRKADAARKAAQSELEDLKAEMQRIADEQADEIAATKAEIAKMKRDAANEAYRLRQQRLNNAR
jgi:hypothetical protein